MQAAILVTHGSRSKRARREIVALAGLLKRRSGLSIFQHAFLDVNRPSIATAIDSCVRKKATGVVLLLNFLNSGNHVKRDIPQLVEEARRRHPGVSFCVSPPIGLHPALPGLYLEWLRDYKKRPCAKRGKR